MTRGHPRGLAPVLLAAGAVGLAAPPAGAAPATAPVPAGEAVCALTDPALDEVSGLAAAGGRWWVAEDSGGRAEVVALDPACRPELVVSLGTAAPHDAEDLATGPDDRGVASLWLADIGDNRGRRETVTLLRFPVPSPPAEPDPGGGGSGPVVPPVVAADPDELVLVYDDGPRDAEALLVDPAGGVAVVSKPLGGTPGVYVPTGPLSPLFTTGLVRTGGVRLGETGVFRDAGRVPWGPAGVLSAFLVTGGAVSPDGSRVVLRTYTDAHEWEVSPAERRRDGTVAFGALLARAPDRVVALPPAEQGEAIAYSEDGTGLLVTGEGAGAVLHRLPALAPAAGPAAVPASPAPAAGAAAAGGPVTAATPATPEQPAPVAEPAAGGARAAAPAPGPVERAPVAVAVAVAVATGAAGLIGSRRRRRNQRLARALTG